MPMIFFLDTDGTTRVGLDSTTSVNVSMPSTATSSSNMDGNTVSDEVIEGNVTISLTGTVTYAKLSNTSDNLNPIDFQKAIQRARRQRRRFTVYYKDTGQPLMQSYDNCVLTGLDFTIDKYSDTITVSLSFEQIFISQAATTTTLSTVVKEEDKPTVEDVTNNGSGTSTEGDTEQDETMFSSDLENPAALILPFPLSLAYDQNRFAG